MAEAENESLFIPNEQTTRSRGRQPGSTVVQMYRPRQYGRYYRVRTEAEWDALSDADRRRYSHVARIEEDHSTSVILDPGCQRCLQKRYDTCRIYTAGARFTYEGRPGTGKCARCRYDGQVCTYQAESSTA